MSVQATYKQCNAIRAIAYRKLNQRPSDYLPDSDIVEFVNDQLHLDLDPQKPMRDQLTMESASDIINRLTA
uniref:Uncharacterized protein n=1 Tax=Eiseniibacteriota bacterium TaxID=2212470 RepID=A0A832I559_UNCEI